MMDDLLIRVLLPIVTAILGAIASVYVKNKLEKSAKPDFLHFEYLSPPKDPLNNRDFYRTLIDKIDNAKQNIFNFGSGFADEEFSFPVGDNIRGYCEAVTRATGRGVHVTRVQSRPLGNKWIEMLLDSLERDPDNIDIYYHPAESLSLINFCVIDPDLEEDCVVELMFSQYLNYRAGSSLHVAGTAIFIDKNPKLANTLRKLIIELTKDADCIPLKTASDFNSPLLR
jgi:hypothetical protein